MCPTAIGVEPLLGPGRGFGPSTRVAASNLYQLRILRNLRDLALYLGQPYST